MRCPKVAILFSHSEADWKSVGEITRNLRLAYDRLSSKYNFRNFNYHYQSATLDILPLASQIIQWNPDYVVFLDHAPNPLHLIKCLGLVKKTFDPKYIIHIYGNFSYFSSEWKNMRLDLTHKKIHFVSASPAQHQFLNNFLIQKDINTICPFPIDPKCYYTSSQLRSETRKKLGIKPKDFLFVFTGRLSLQKNITLLLEEFNRYLKSRKNNHIKLILAGPFDDIGASFHDINQWTGHQFYLWSETLKRLGKNASTKIQWIGNLDRAELCALYNAADCYISLSMHHDEDFGMAPREALFCGCPSILTSWGGFAQFIEEPFSQVINFEFTPNALEIKTEEIPICIDRAVLRPLSNEQRNELSIASNNKYSVKTCSRIMEKILSSDFQHCKSFNWRIEDMARLTSKGIYSESGTGKNSLYRDFYEKYI